MHFVLCLVVILVHLSCQSPSFVHFLVASLSLVYVLVTFSKIGWFQACWAIKAEAKSRDGWTDQSDS